MQPQTRNTRQKQQLLKALRSQRLPRTAEELHGDLAASSEGASLSTVYRNLDRMAQCGTVRKLSVLGDGRTRYELTGDGHHHHVVCRSCSRVVPFDLCPLDGFVRRLERQTGFRFDDHTLEVSGLCADCQ